MVPQRMNAPRIPLSTYRLQFNRTFTFSQAADLLPYLADLGISHCYASPYLRARPGSLHGYDIIDHHSLNPEIGSPEDYERFVRALHEHGMGQILDIVPNHMGIMGSDNSWWLDVLENGEASSYAEFFDIDWYPLKEELQGKVLVPVLGDQYGIVLDRGELKLTFDKEKGEFSIWYFRHRFPVNPREYPRVLNYGLEALEQRLGAQDENRLELESLIAAFSHLPGREETAPERRVERLRDKEIHKRRLAALCTRSPQVANFLEENVRKINGTPGDSASFDALHELIKAQAYRLAYWRVATDDINYRRFFDVNDLAGLRQENEQVFNQTHEFVLQLLREAKIDGLRVDHPDGLYDPQQYFERLQASADPSADREGGARPYYIVAEKILTGEEKLAQGWPIFGTTGYGFSNLVSGLFVDANSEKKMDRIYRRLTGRHTGFRELLYESKKLVMDRSLNSELNVLANRLSRIALADRHTCDFTLKSLRDALTEMIACFPVYRTYVTPGHLSASDRRYIDDAVNCAKTRSTAADSSVYAFIRQVLLSTCCGGHADSYQRSVTRFAMKFQQYTSALIAKGLEDTIFYRYNRLVSLNDVGGDPMRFGVRPAEFHRAIEQRAQLWPYEMLATSTHDSKRSEDVRARINVLSEIPIAWLRRVRSWRELNRDKKTLLSGAEAPTLNDEYLLYQTLIGAWPFSSGEEEPPASFLARMRDYMRKAIREAKEKTSWVHQDREYEAAVADFVTAVLASKQFRDDFLPFQRKVAYFGMLNSLSQTLIKLTVPGVPDLYQGSELWDLRLVDPDNRGPVDYDARRQALGQLQNFTKLACDQQAKVAGDLADHMEDGRIKLYVIWKTLALRNRQPELLQDGDYVPMETAGDRAQHIVGFLRRRRERTVIVAVPRLCAQLLQSEPRLPVGRDVWQDTRLKLPPLPGKTFRNLCTEETVVIAAHPDGDVLTADRLFTRFPVALLLG
jgi:(1->4)-alpha-D-glucan 1-alpha-D-glucosylmutase